MKLDNFEAFKKRYADLYARWTGESNLHLTYAFFPEEQDPRKLLELLRMLPLEEKEVSICGLGHFGKKVLYARVDDETIHRNRAKIDAVLSGVHEDFDPHVTLARIKSYDEALIARIIAENETVVLGRLESSIHLIKSTLTSQGAVYEVIDEASI